ncbi:MAG: T9SS type A sorting domain-containing protein, partial [Saprospiraceae bacterium]
GLMEITDGGNELRLSNNAWKAVPIDYPITSTTVLTFQFRSFIEGEIHGIGLDDNQGISSDKTFRLYGTQAWGNGDFADYPADGQWRSYTIPVGAYLDFTAAWLFFVSDHDTGGANGNSMFRNVRLTEGAGCPPDLAPEITTAALPGYNFSTTIFPNPTAGNLSVTTEITREGPLRWTIVNTTGTAVQSGSQSVAAGTQTFSLAVESLPPGTYFLRQEQADGETRSVRFTKLP